MKYVLAVLAMWGNNVDDAEAELNGILARIDAPEVVKEKVAAYLLSLKAPFSGEALKQIVAGFVAEILSGKPGYNENHGGLA